MSSNSSGMTVDDQVRFLDVVPGLTPDASPMSDPSLNPTPSQNCIESEYFPSETNSKTAIQHELPFRPNTTTSIIASQVKKKKGEYIPLTMKKVLGQELNPFHSIFFATSFVPAADGPCFPTPSQAFWYYKTSSRLSELLQQALYPADLQTEYIDFFNHSVIPALGPKPTSDAQWTSHLTHARSPLEVSWNLQGHDNFEPRQEIRFKIEPISPLGGIPEDLFNQHISNFFVSALAKSKICPTIDLTVWNHFSTELCINPAEIERALELLPSNSSLPSWFLAYDLPSNNSAPVLTGHLFPYRRALLNGKSKTEVLLSAIKTLPSPTLSVLPLINKIESFLSNPDNELAATLESLSFICFHSPNLTLDLKTTSTSLSAISRIYTHFSPPSTTQAALHHFHQFWESFTGLEGEWKSMSTQTAPYLHFTLEIVPGDEDPRIEILVPIWECGIEESGVREGLENFFAERGWGLDVGELDGGKGMRYTWLRFGFCERRV